jgi:hypothetical protein
MLRASREKRCGHAAVASSFSVATKNKKHIKQKGTPTLEFLGVPWLANDVGVVVVRDEGVAGTETGVGLAAVDVLTEEAGVLWLDRPFPWLLSGSGERNSFNKRTCCACSSVGIR